jgi:hypothetical protein
LGVPASAATFSTLIKVNNQVCANDSNSAGNTSACTGQVVHPGLFPAVTDYSATARAELGSIGVSGSTFTSGDALDDVSITAAFEDTLFFGIDSGTVSISVDVAGTRDWSLPASGIANNNTYAEVSATTYLLTGFPSTVTTIYQSTIAVAPAFSPEPYVNTQTGSLGTTTNTFAFSGGQLQLSAVMNAYFRCRSGFNELACSTSADFLNSLRFTGASVFDADGNAVTTTVTSSSGFDYLKGLEPHSPPVDPPSVIPLPAAGWLLLAGVAGLAGLRRRRT